MPTSAGRYTASRQLTVYGNKCLDANGQGTSNGTAVDHLGLQRSGQPAVERELQRHDHRRPVGTVPGRQRHRHRQRHADPTVVRATAAPTSNGISALPRASSRTTASCDPGPRATHRGLGRAHHIASHTRHRGAFMSLSLRSVMRGLAGTCYRGDDNGGRRSRPDPGRLRGHDDALRITERDRHSLLLRPAVLAFPGAGRRASDGTDDDRRHRRAAGRGHLPAELRRSPSPRPTPAPTATPCIGRRRRARGRSSAAGTGHRMVAGRRGAEHLAGQRRHRDRHPAALRQRRRRHPGAHAGEPGRLHRLQHRADGSPTAP